MPTIDTKQSLSPPQIKNNKSKVIIAFLALFLFVALIFYVQEILSSKRTTKFLLAMQIRQDGIETVKNILNKNLVRFPQKQRECWNTLPRWIGVHGCEKPENKIAEGSYFIDNGQFGFDLIPQKAKIEEGHFSENYRLKENSIKHLYAIPKPDLNDFYREIDIEYSGQNKEMMVVISTVYFKSPFKIEKYSTSRLFTNLNEFHE